MPQLRQNIVTGEWVVIAPERAKRPEEFIQPKKEKNPHETCIFCIGSPAHKTRYSEYDSEHTYIMPNKFPAFVDEGQHEVRSHYPKGHLYHMRPAFGTHDVVVINHQHMSLYDFPLTVMTDLWQNIQKRYQDLRKQPDIGYTIAIYNYGIAGGSSVDHPHAQILASSIVPEHIKKELHGSERYYELHGDCVYCSIVKHEKGEDTRILAENDDFILITFFAARFPFEVWLLPKKHEATFENATNKLIESFSRILIHGLSLLDKTLQDPSLNFYLHSLPNSLDDAPYYHWHLEIAPRLSIDAGYELGSGMIIDVVSPEKAAEFLLADK